MDWKIKPCKKLSGEIVVPPDKSISHRAVMFGSIAKGKTTIRNFLLGGDCLSTLKGFKSLGAVISLRKNTVTISGKGLRGLKASKKPVYLGNSGTSMRIMSGILAGQDFQTVLTGDESLSKRPMKRIIEPLELMGAKVEPLEGGDHAPLRITGPHGPLKPISYRTPVASAQVKSCILAAGLYADGETVVTEPLQSRDHTERMLQMFSADIKREKLSTSVAGGIELSGINIDVPGDISSAAFFIVAALIVPGSRVIIRNMGINPTRTGIMDVLKMMGADIKIIDKKEGPEPTADIEVRSSALKGVKVDEKVIPLLIDEVPILMVAASVASGETVIEGVSELKVKETDRIMSMSRNLSLAGVEIVRGESEIIVRGSGKKFRAAAFESFKDHRTAMSMAVASLLAGGVSVIKDTACVETSYPGFLDDLGKLSA